MTDDTKTSEFIKGIEGMTKEEVEIVTLRKEAQDLMLENQRLQFQVEAMGDMQRMNLAGLCLPYFLGRIKDAEHLVPLDLEEAIEYAITAADEMVSKYDKIVREKSVEWQKIANAKPSDPTAN